MIAEKTITVQVTGDGMIPVPTELRQQLGLKPFQTVRLKEIGGQLVVTLSRREVGERVVALMREVLVGVTQADIDEGRLDDAYRG